jgi:membrane protein
MSSIISLLQKTFKSWSDDKASQLAAALSYYTVFSLAPLLLIVISIAGFVFGEAEVRRNLLSQIQSLIGKQGTVFISTALSAENSPSSNLFGSITGFVTLLLGASGVFAQLKTAFNEIWHIYPENKGLMASIKSNFLSFSMVVGIGFLLLVSLIISAVITALGTFFQGMLPFSSLILELINFVVSFGIITVLFAAMFKVLPDTKIRMNDVWFGALFTSLLFTIGKFGIGWYLGHSAAMSKYGAAGSMVIILLWVYYSAQILFFGAEFTKEYTYCYGSKKDEARNKSSLGKEVLESFAGGLVIGLEKNAKKLVKDIAKK